MSQKQLAEKALQLRKTNEAKAAALDFTDYPDELLSPVETSEILGIAPQTLANWRCTGQGPRYVKLGRATVRYPKSALQEFADAELTVREPADELSDAAIVKQIARLANRLARRQRQSEAA